MLNSHSTARPGLQLNRACALRISFGLVLFLFGFVAAQTCGAQTDDQEENQPVTQPMGQPQDQQTGQGQNQQMAQPQQEQDGQPPNQQSGQSQNQQAGQPGQTGQTGQPRNQQAEQGQDQRLNQPPAPEPMSAEQIIAILQQEPVILSSIRDQIGQLTRTDPDSISDESLFERIREGGPVRDLAAREIMTRGYTVNPSEPGPVPGNPANPRPMRTTPPQGPQTPRAQAPPYDDPNNPQVQRRLSPYRNMPSLLDLYSQFRATKAKLRRFGSDAFSVGTGNANELPMDLPAGPDYVLGPGDALIVNMWGGQSQRLNRAIDRQGQIQLPEAGTVMVNGMTISQAESAIQKALDTEFKGEHVEISLGRLRTVRVYVVGDVQRPGAYDVSSLSTPLSALYPPGGPTSRGSLRTLRQYRDKQLVRQVDLYDFLLRGMRSNNDRLEAGDTILVPPVGPQVSVEGMVHRPAIYELDGEQGLNQVLDLAGGLLVSANLKQINVERIDAHQSRSMFSLQLPDSQNELAQKLAAFKVQDGDDVEITQIQPSNAEAVYLEGHVVRPGKYPYRDGMTINDLLHSYADALPEPSDHGELVRFGRS